jgi:hypothetical protein
VALENSNRVRSLPFGCERHITCNAIEELKYDGFRALAYVEPGRCRLVSRNHNEFKTFPELAAAGVTWSGRGMVCEKAHSTGGGTVRPYAAPPARSIFESASFGIIPWTTRSV